MIDVLFMAGGQGVLAKAVPSSPVLYLLTVILQGFCFWLATIVLSFFIQIRFVERRFNPKWRVEHYGFLLSGLVPIMGAVGSLMIQSGVVVIHRDLSAHIFVGLCLLLMFVLLISSMIRFIVYTESFMDD